MASTVSVMCLGTRVLQKAVMRLNPPYVITGMMPGRMGTVMPTDLRVRRGATHAASGERLSSYATEHHQRTCPHTHTLAETHIYHSPLAASAAPPTLTHQPTDTQHTHARMHGLPPALLDNLEVLVDISCHTPASHPHSHPLAHPPAVLDKLEVLVDVVEELRDDEVRPRVHLALQVVNVRPVVLLHLHKSGVGG